MFHSPPVIVAIVVSVLTMIVRDTSAFSSVQYNNEKGTIIKGSFRSSSLPIDSPTALSMGIFDAFSKAFQNTEYGPPPEKVRATARHILVPTDGEARIIMKMITSGEQSFEECAEQFSTCPSASKGGSLGSFAPGTMVKEFDQVIFNPETKPGQVIGPVLTQFGHHVIVVDKRTGGGDMY